MHLKRLEISGFKSFAKKAVFEFNSPVSAIVGPNGSGKSNVAESIRFVLGEQSMKSMRGKRGEDLIWNGSQSVGRSNHASVAIVFDNTGKEFDVDYDEVVVKRQVFRDGSNQYFINNSQVRLRDIIELLARVHIGATGHHIISQGEADRILNANTKERRAMIEEALGLKIYKWKIDESEKKLIKTEENLKQVQSLRREIAPHIRFLKKSVEKIEKAKEMREDLKELYAEYLKREDLYLKHRKEDLAGQLSAPLSELKEVENKLEHAKEELSKQEGDNPKADELVSVERNISQTRQEKDELSRAIGRIEGMIEYEQRRIKKINEEKNKVEIVAYKDVKVFTEDLKGFIDEAEKQDSIDAVFDILKRVRHALGDFLSHVGGGTSSLPIDTKELEVMQNEKKEIEQKLMTVEQKAKEFEGVYERLKQEIEKEKDSSRDLERAVFEMMARKSELSSVVNRIKNEQQQLEKEEIAFKEEIKEGIALIGRDITLYENFAISEDESVLEDRQEQEKRRRNIEKIKIKLEEHGIAGSDEVMKEYEEVCERDSFLEKEILDLEKSKEALRELIKELSDKLDSEFKEGIKKINKQFQEFFALMFGGGGASLVVVAQKKRKRSDTDITLGDEVPDMEEEAEEGIDINVSLPRKKIKGLQMLSGGERALTSIALIFAVSQVNPPPFLVLDETDAALDEANSRKYGDMIENLSAHSQLIVITHNRETMSRAGILYGVTMGSDAVSKLLSIKFEEAEGYAK